ncbi:hypothetical protein ACK8HX_02025 [Oryzobacter sp. R7]|uniref:hypothetical protein n=1 Tax=Oryzobacter faecalis TaxID=3388656 RepID=UPI00398CB282
MGRRTNEVHRIIDRARYEAFVRADWSTRRATVRGMFTALVGAAALAALIFLLTGGVLLLPVGLGGEPDEFWPRATVAALTAIGIALAYLAAAAQRQVGVLEQALIDIDRVTREP